MSNDTRHQAVAAARDAQRGFLSLAERRAGQIETAYDKRDAAQEFVEEVTA